MYFVIYIEGNLLAVIQIYGVIVIIVMNIMLVFILLNEFIKANWEKIKRCSSIVLGYIGSKKETDDKNELFQSEIYPNASSTDKELSMIF